MYNVFISHYGKDDEHVQNLKTRLCERGYNVRNFSVDSTNHKDGRKPSNAVVERLLRMRISWSSTIICLIGEDTHKRPWVDHEMEEAYRQGKRIIGIYKHGCANNVDLPEKFKKYGSALIGWNSVDKLGDLIEGNNLPNENPDGSIASPLYHRTNIKC